MSIWVYMRRSLKVVSSFKLILITPILEHVLVVFHISRLEVFLESLRSLSRTVQWRAISWWLLRLSKRALCDCIIDCRPLL